MRCPAYDRGHSHGMVLFSSHQGCIFFDKGASGANEKTPSPHRGTSVTSTEELKARTAHPSRRNKRAIAR